MGAVCAGHSLGMDVIDRHECYDRANDHVPLYFFKAAKAFDLLYNNMDEALGVLLDWEG